MPRRVQASVAWRHLSNRARVVLLVFMARHNGHNNGRIALGVRAIGEAIGDQNHRANGLAIAQLIELGFLECTSDANHHRSRTREFRITFIPTGDKKSGKRATHEYDGWRPQPGKKRKFGGARTAAKTVDPVATTTAEMKLSVARTAAPVTGNCGFGGDDTVAETAALIGNQSQSDVARFAISQPVSRIARAADDIRVDVEELRDWVDAAIHRLGYGGARQLAQSCGVPEPSLSRFRKGKALPHHYRLPLQQACGRCLRYADWKGANE